MKTNKFMSFAGSMLLILLSVIFGGGLVLAEVGAALPDAGVTIEDTMTVESGIENEPDLYTKAIDENLIKMRPMATPTEQISRAKSKATSVDSWIVKYYSVGTRAMVTSVTEAVNAAVTGDRITLKVADPKLFAETDSFRFEGLTGYDEDGTTANTRPLVGYVYGKDGSGYPIVQLINYKAAGNPGIPLNTKLVRMGRAGAELDAQTGKFSNIPEPDTNYCQNFMMQVEESTFHKIHSKEVNWTFNDLEEDAIYEMKSGMEGSFLFGEKRKKKNLNGDNVYFTGGIYYMAGKDIEIGTYVSASGKTTITTDQFNNLCKQLFTGNNAGNKTKIGFAGSDALEALSNMTDASRKIIERDNVEKWNLKFKSFDSNFGEVLVMHHEFMDLNLKSDEIFIFDPAYLTKATFLSWGRTVIDFAKIGVRKSTGVVLQEASALYLRYPMAHARVKIATSPVAVTGVDLNKATLALAVGASEQLYATITPADASNESVTWASSAVAKATVSATGVVTGVEAGTATITVTAVDTTGGTITDTCVVTVS